MTVSVLHSVLVEVTLGVTFRAVLASRSPTSLGSQPPTPGSLSVVSLETESMNHLARPEDSGYSLMIQALFVGSIMPP